MNMLIPPKQTDEIRKIKIHLRIVNSHFRTSLTTTKSLSRSIERILIIDQQLEMRWPNPETFSDKQIKLFN
jgi:hypothetical protein